MTFAEIVTIEEVGMAYEEMLTIEVARAAEMLDHDVPGWADQIDTERLNIGKGEDCIAGQLGLKWEKCHALWLEGVNGAFTLNPSNYSPFAADYTKPFWLNEINKRLQVQLVLA